LNILGYEIKYNCFFLMSRYHDRFYVSTSVIKMEFSTIFATVFRIFTHVIMVMRPTEYIVRALALLQSN